MHGKAALSRRRLRRFSVMLGVLLFAWMVRAIYSGFPLRAVARAEQDLRNSACSKRNSSTPPDDAWRQARDEVEFASYFPGFKEELDYEDTQVCFCCTEAYLHACHEAHQRAGRRAYLRPPGPPTQEASDEMSYRVRDPREFISAEDRLALCGDGGPFRECGQCAAADLCPEVCGR